MRAYSHMEIKKQLKKKLIISGYLSIVGIALFIYSVQNFNSFMNDQAHYYRYTLPRFLVWLYDTIGPIMTISLMLLISALTATTGLYKCFNYRRALRSLSLTKETAQDISDLIIDDD